MLVFFTLIAHTISSGRALNLSSMCLTSSRSVHDVVA
jgi:hypothetical protein